jgi:hypothetical protein
MNPRITTTVVGVLMLLLGLLALFYPDFVMAHVLGYAVHPAHSANFVRGEVRAAYGGIFVVAGAATILAAADPLANRGRILFVGLLWLGACAGRLFGAFIDGSPGVWGWLSVGFELVIGAALVLVAQTGPAHSERAAPPESAAIPSASPAAPVP